MGKRKRFIDLSELPRKGNKINWFKAIGYKCIFKYGDIKGIVEILDFCKKENKLKIKINNNITYMNPANFRKCQFGKLLGMFNDDFRLDIGQRIINYNEDGTIKRDFTIIDRKKKLLNNGRKYKAYKIKCNLCNFNGGKHYSLRENKYKDELWILECNILSKYEYGCPCCGDSPNIVVKGINDISTTNPKLIKYFKNIEDSYKYTYSSNKKIILKCPNCGCEKTTIIDTLNRQGFSCKKCGDGISYPNKFMFNLLEQLGLEFQTEYCPQWIDKSKYDFYIPSKNLIIEMDGGWHNRDNNMSGQTKEQSQEIDRYKDRIAKQHDLEVIRIDCDYCNIENRFEYIKNNTINKLNKIFDLNNIDWNKIIESCCSSFVKKACCYKKNNPDLTTKEIGEIMKCSSNTIARWLKIGNELKWCSYNSKEEIEKGKIKSKNKNREKLSKRVEVFKDEISLGIFNSCHDIDNISEELFGIKLKYSCIARVCTGERRFYKGYTFKYVDEIHKEFKPKLRKPVEIFKNNISLGVFSSCSDLEKQSEKLFEIKFISKGISRACRNNKPYKGFTFKYITSEEYYKRISEDPTLKESE